MNCYLAEYSLKKEHVDRGSRKLRADVMSCKDVKTSWTRVVDLMNSAAMTIDVAVHNYSDGERS